MLQMVHSQHLSRKICSPFSADYRCWPSPSSHPQPQRRRSHRGSGTASSFEKEAEKNCSHRRDHLGAWPKGIITAIALA